MADTCSRCGSKKVIPGVPLLDSFGDYGHGTKLARVRVHGDPDAQLAIAPKVEAAGFRVHVPVWQETVTLD